MRLQARCKCYTPAASGPRPVDDLARHARTFRVFPFESHRAIPGIRRGRHVRAVGALAVLAVVATLATSSVAWADLIVPANGTYTTNGGQTDLACTDVIVGGTLNVNSGGLVNVRHITIQPGGIIDGGSGVIQLGGDWTNGGTFTPATSTVRFNDLCGLTSATVNGSTSFFNARFVSSIGKNHVFQVGTTQTIAGVLEIAGSSPSPIQFRSGTPGQVANLHLLPAGTQQIQHVGVTDVWATGQWLAPSLTNQGGGGNANRWFGAAPPGVSEYPVPGLGDLATLALAALLAAFGFLNLRRRAPDRARRLSFRRGPKDHP